VLARHDPPALREVGALVEVDSDHYLMLRHAEQITDLLLEHLTAAQAVTFRASVET
jgi:hypothetical protein